MYPGRSRQDGVWGFEVIRIAGNISHRSARLFHDQRAGGDIPGVDLLFPVAIYPPAGHVADLKRGAAQAAHSLGGAGEVAEQAQVALEFLAGCDTENRLPAVISAGR